MATIIQFGKVEPPARPRESADHRPMFNDIHALKVGDKFQAEFNGRYSATCARRSLTAYARRIGYVVSAHQAGKQIEIERTA